MCAEIGNVMGLVRLTRLGKKTHLANIAEYVLPESFLPLQHGCMADELPLHSTPELQSAAQQLDNSLECLQQGLDEGNNVDLKALPPFFS